MNKRERFLLVFLAACIILAGGFKFLISPKLTDLKQSSIDLVDITRDKKDAENNSNKEKEIKKQTVSLTKKIEDISLPYFPELISDKVAYFFQGIASNTGVIYDSVTMTDKTVSQVLAQSVVDTSPYYPAKEAAKQILDDKYKPIVIDPGAAKKAKKAKDKQVPQDAVEMMTVVVSFRSDYKSALSYIDKVKSSDRMVRISSLDMAIDKEGAFVTNVTMECFGVKKLTDNDAILKDVLPKPTGKSNPFQ